MLFDNNPAANKIRYYTGFLMVALYSGLGLLFLFTDIGIDTFPGYRKGIGIVLLVYAGVRVVLTIQKRKKFNKENE